MAVNTTNYYQIIEELNAANATLVAVSKTKPVEDILNLYNLGQRDFGENYVQELVDKQKELPKDIRWHFIGHLQTNKVKLIANFVQLIHGVDSLKLLEEINKQGEKNDRIIACLLQVHVAEEETKFGFDQAEADAAIQKLNKEPLKNVSVKGLMGMASFSDNENKVREEFKNLKRLFDKHAKLTTHNSQLTTLSMGMSGDYKTAIQEGSNMVRIGSLLFGERSKK